MTSIAPTLQTFFSVYLPTQHGASHHTTTAYRDAWKLLLRFLNEQKHIEPSAVQFTDFTDETIPEFLNYLELTRHNTIATRNARLAAIHAFFAYAAYKHPEHAHLIAHVLAIRPKKTGKRDIDYLNEEQIQALVAACDPSRWVGRRDLLMLHLLISTGFRVSELTHLTWSDISLDRSPYLLCHGKGRKDRTTPVTKDLARLLTDWQNENRHEPRADTPVFTAQGSTRAMSTDAVAQRLHVIAQRAARLCPSLESKTISPHVLRHTTAMRMLHSGIDIATIALWLGHESIVSTRAYLHADLTMKEQALARTASVGTPHGMYQPSESLLEFLETL